MKVRQLNRWALLGITVGVLAAIGVPAAIADVGIGGRQPGGSTPTSAPTPVGADKPPSGPPVVVKPGDNPNPGRTPVGADKPPSGPPVVVKPGEGQPASPKPADPVDPGDTDSAGKPSGPAPGQGGQPAGVQLVRASHGPSSATSQVEVARCPAGTKVYGGGASVVGGEGRVMITTLRPGSSVVDGLDRYTGAASARPSGGGFKRAFPWSLDVFAVCGPELPGYERVIASNDEQLTPRVTARAQCPDGKRVIGTGGAIGGTAGRFSLTKVAPNAKGAFVTVTGADDTSDGFDQQLRSVQAVAVCAAAPAGYQVVSQRTPVEKGNHAVAVLCPNGKTAYAAGMVNTDSVGHTYVDGVAPLRIDRGSPAPQLVQVTAQQSPSLVESSIKAFAICAS